MATTNSATPNESTSLDAHPDKALFQPIDVTSSYSLCFSENTVPPEYQGRLSDFGLPTALKRLHRQLKEIVNRIPFETPDKLRARDTFLSLITNERELDDATLKAFSHELGNFCAMQDLLDKRINSMSPMDFIADPETATPDLISLSSVRDRLLKGDRERFAKVEIKQGTRSTEWDKVDLDNDGPDTPF